MDDYYTYAYLREDKTPYYIGKGRKRRAFTLHKRMPRPPKERILFLKENLTEEQAFKHEVYMIAVLGRKDLGTGILRNLTDGGEGGSGWKPSSKTRSNISKAKCGKLHTTKAKLKMSEALRGKTHTEATKVKMSKSRKGRPWSQARRDAYNKSKEE